MSFYGAFATHAERADSGIAPVLEITLNSAQWHGGTAMHFSAGVASARGTSYDPRVLEAGWGDVKRAFSPSASDLSRLETTVTVADTDRAVQTALEAGQQRGSAASIYWVVPGNATDYSLRFRGVLESWRYQPGQVELHLRTDDVALRSYLPNWTLLASEHSGIVQTSVGIHVPLIYGTHDSTGLSGTGMLPAFPIYEVDEVGIYYYVACLGQAKEILDVYVDGVVQTIGIGNDYLVNYNYVKANKTYTVIQFLSAKTADNVVTFDAEGYETTGNTGVSTTAPSGTEIVNPVEQMRHLLVNHAENRYQSGAWDLTAGDLLDADSWAESAQWAAAHGLEGAGYLGGTTEKRYVVDIFNDWLESYPTFRAYWTAEGKIGLRVMSLDFPGYRQPTDPPLLVTADELGDTFDYNLDSSDATDSFSASYLYGQAFGDFFSSLTVIDPELNEGISSQINMPWSVARAT